MFSTLLDELLPAGDVRLAVDDLLRQKAAGLENEQSPADPVLQEWLRETLYFIKQRAGSLPSARHKEIAVLDELFRETVLT